MTTTNPPLSQYALPANINDFGDNIIAYEAMRQIWNWNLNGFTLSSIAGNPWGSLYDVDRYFYFNPLTTPLEGGAPQAIQWFANSGRIPTFFASGQSSAPYNLTPSQLMQLNDQGYLVDVPGFETGFPMVPSACPSLDYNQPKEQWAPFIRGLYGPRGWQDEYCEYSILRNAEGKIISVMFTCENPEYWYALWHVDPKVVLAIYQEVINPKVQIADLYLLDENGNPVVNPQTGQPAYNPLNKWNSGTVTTESSGGAMHLTSPPNTLGAEVYLAAAATLIRPAAHEASAQNLICCSRYGRPYRNSDPHIGFSANQFVNQAGLTISLSDPVGLYIQQPDFENFKYQTPDSTPAAKFWRVVRGKGPDEILHAVFEVPAEYGYTVSDITINGEAIQWASQIAATFHIALRAWGQQPDPQTQPIQQPQPCPVYDQNQGAPALPLLLTFLDGSLLNAYKRLFTVNINGNDIVANSPVMPAPILKQGSRVTNLVLQLANVEKDTTISFGPGITAIAKLVDDSANALHSVGRAGRLLESATFQLDITVDVDAPLGQRSLAIIDPDLPASPPVPCVLTIVGPNWPNA